jgi:hypothetical protein
MRRPGVVLALVAALVATASPAAGHGREPDWQRYVLGPRTTDVRPVAVTAVSGAVDNPRALVTGRGVTTLTHAAGGPAPVITIDYGVDVGGIPYLAVSAAAGGPALRASFSESRRFADEDGDNNGEGPCCGIAPPGAEPRRWNEWTPTGPGVLRTQYQQGGERYERITLTTPGTVTLTRVGIDYKPFLGTPDRYDGWFLSSDDTLNRIWYAGAHTIQLNMVPPGAQAGNTLPALIDGAKRDRAIWSGDLVHQTPQPVELLRAQRRRVRARLAAPVCRRPGAQRRSGRARADGPGRPHAAVRAVLLGDLLHARGERLRRLLPLHR